MRFKVLFAMALTPFLLQGSFLCLNDQNVVKTQEPKNLTCTSPLHRAHFDVRHTEANGVGYKEGYTTLEWFGILDHNSYLMPFLDFRGHVFNNGKLAGNFGLGERTIIPAINHAFGLYVYYDVRQENHGLTVHQISPGIELLGKRMEYRMNGYFPVGRHESHSYGKEFARFQGHSILMKRKKKFAMAGGDAELGVHMTQSTRHDVYAGVGSYYLTADPFSAWGGKARLLWRYRDYVSMEASYSYDKLFRNLVQGTVALSYPLGKTLKRKGDTCSSFNDLTLSRTAFAPYRFEIPVVKKHRHHTRARNPATGQPWRVWFVNNTSSSDGTFESPFPTLIQAQNASGPNDLIYVFSGNGTSQGMDQGIALQNGQKLFGAGISQTLPTTVGNLEIPALSPSRPILTNTVGVGNVVSLANGNEISGLDIRATVSGANLINSPTNTINSGYIHDNILSGTVNHIAMNIIGNGVFFVQNNTCLDLSVGSPFQGIRLSALSGAVLQAFITNNFTSGYQFSMGMNVDSGSSGSFDILNNTLVQTETNSGAAIFIGGTLGRFINANIRNNQLTMLSDFGIQISGNTNICMTGQIENNMINKTGVGDGIVIQNGGTGNQISFSITNNQIQQIGAGHFGVNGITTANSTICLDMSNNSSGNGYNFNNSAGGNFLVSFINNTGSVTQTGTITLIPPGTCPICP